MSEQMPDVMFQREDESPDAGFYTVPRMVAHIDQQTIDALTGYYDTFIPAQAAVLDLMSSWISHLPDKPYARVAGLGMNAAELAQNPQLHEYVVHDLNEDPRLPFADATFDRATIAVSIQYLIRPVEVMTSLARVLKPGGSVCIAMSHRLFPTKAIRAFRELSPQDRIGLVGYYLQTAGFDDLQFDDASPPAADPLWLVTGQVPPAA